MDSCIDYFTGKHVAAVFERLGFDPEGGIKVFNALCEALRRKEHMYQTARMADSAVATGASPHPAAVHASGRGEGSRGAAQTPLSPQSGENIVWSRYMYIYLYVCMY